MKLPIQPAVALIAVALLLASTLVGCQKQGATLATTAAPAGASETPPPSNASCQTATVPFLDLVKASVPPTVEVETRAKLEAIYAKAADAIFERCVADMWSDDFLRCIAQVDASARALCKLSLDQENNLMISLKPLTAEIVAALSGEARSAPQSDAAPTP